MLLLSSRQANRRCLYQATNRRGYVCKQDKCTKNYAFVDLVSSDGKEIVNQPITLLTAFLVVEVVSDLVLDEFYHAGFIAEHPGDNLPRMLETFRFDNRPGRMVAGIAAPFEVMQIPGGMDLLHGSVAVFSGVGGFDKITIHLTSLVSHCKRDKLCRNYIPLCFVFK